MQKTVLWKVSVNDACVRCEDRLRFSWRDRDARVSKVSIRYIMKSVLVRRQSYRARHIYAAS